MRVKFWKTLRRHMRDPSVFPASKIWTDADNDLAKAILRYAREHVDCVADEDFVRAFAERDTTRDPDVVRAMYARLHEFPHIFELAAARHDVNSYDLHGVRVDTQTHAPRACKRPRQRPLRVLGTVARLCDLWQPRPRDVDVFGHVLAVALAAPRAPRISVPTDVLQTE